MSSIKTIYFLVIVVIAFNCNKREIIDDSLGVRNVIVELNHKVGNQNFVIGNSNTNAFGEAYTLNRFQYYISNVQMVNTGNNNTEKEMDSYHLIDATSTTNNKFNFSVNNSFNAISFIIGVDSLRNVSGAQTGALDPLNGMFWTWNSGYIMAKMEGSSPASPESNKELTFHIGGYSGINSAIRKITLPFPAGTTNTSVGGNCKISIDVDINKWFNGAHNVKIADGGLAMSISDRTKKFADNYATMFSIKTVTN